MEFGDSRVPQRIWDKVVIADTGCWLWTGATGGRAERRYGIASLDGKVQGVHRWIHGVVHGPATKDEHVHHRCSVSLCVNPEHLTALPTSEHNGLWQRARTHCPSGHPYSPENTYITRAGARQCRECTRRRRREQWRARGSRSDV